MFASLQAEIVDRLFAAEEFFVGSFADGRTRKAAVAKGLSFVQMYAVYEYTVVNSVRAGIGEIKNQGHQIGAVRASLLPLVLDPHLTSAAECGQESRWRRRLELFARAFCSDTVDVPDATFPRDGSHFRREQIETIWELFGLTGPIVPRGPLFNLISELVEHRNAIAHGRSTAQEIGRSYVMTDILQKFGDTRDLCLHILTSIQNHCSNPANIRR